MFTQTKHNIEENTLSANTRIGFGYERFPSGCHILPTTNKQATAQHPAALLTKIKQKTVKASCLQPNT